MTIVQNEVRTARLVDDGVDASQAFTIDFLPVHWLVEEAMAEHAKANEGQSDGLAEEDLAKGGRDVGEGISDATNDEILKECGVLYEGCSRAVCGEVAFFDQVDWKS